MGVVGSLPLTNNNDIKNEQSLSTFNQSNNNEVMSVIPDVIINDPIKIFHHQKSNETMLRNDLCRNKHKSGVSIGRYSKHRRCKNKEIIKRKLRREKNRLKTQILNTKHDNIREQLRKQIQELELKQNNLLLRVEKLYLYKYRLETICQQASLNYEFIE